MFKHQSKDQAPKPRGRWQDDDDSNSNSNFKQQPVSKAWNSKADTSSKYPQSHPQPQPQSIPPKKDNSFQLEQKLLNDIFQPTGISVRPSDALLNEFLKRAKNLDRDKIFNGIMDKLMNYQAYVTNQENVKTLTKCLYLVDHLVQNKLEDIYEAFEERVELFSNIKESYPLNKKIIDICNSIINAYGGNQGKGDQIQDSSYTNMSNNTADANVNGGNTVQLLDLGFTDNNILNQDSSQQVKDVLEDIFDNHNSNNTPIVSQPLTKQFEAITPNTDLNKKGQAKGFAFIKSKAQSGDTQKTQPFSFIKPKTVTVTSELDDIFNNNSSSNTTNAIPIITMTTNTTIQPQEVNALIDLTKLTFTNNAQKQQQQDMGPKFNYDLVYENTNVFKEKNDKDPFNFVNDMIKAKKVLNPK